MFKRYEFKHPATGFVVGTVIESYQGYSFTPADTFGRRRARKWFPSLEESVPHWARDWIDKGCIFVPLQETER